MKVWFPRSGEAVTKFRPCNLASRLSKKGKSKQIDEDAVLTPKESSLEADLGWKSAEPKKKSRRKSTEVKEIDMLYAGSEENGKRDLAHRRRLIKELAARLERDRQLRYAEREFEMQRLLMGKGGKKKIQGVEKVEGDGDDDEEETQDEIDARRGRKQKSSRKVVDEATYRPRVYKWRLERKR